MRVSTFEKSNKKIQVVVPGRWPAGPMARGVLYSFLSVGDHRLKRSCPAWPMRTLRPGSLTIKSESEVRTIAKRKRSDWRSYPATPNMRTGHKVSWNYYDRLIDAQQCAEAAK